MFASSEQAWTCSHAFPFFVRRPWILPSTLDSAMSPMACSRAFPFGENRALCPSLAAREGRAPCPSLAAREGRAPCPSLTNEPSEAAAVCTAESSARCSRPVSVGIALTANGDVLTIRNLNGCFAFVSAAFGFAPRQKTITKYSLSGSSRWALHCLNIIYGDKRSVYGHSRGMLLAMRMTEPRV
jgi:hypothetical protein